MRALAIATILLVTPIFVLGATVAATGVVSVKVHENSADGANLYIPVPALLFDLAVLAAPVVIPERELADIRREIAPFRQGLKAFAEELENMPSGVLVEVQNGDEQVKITKEWRTLRIEVQSDDADVSISVPVRFLSRSLDIF
jgi:hypothetical protein